MTPVSLKYSDRTDRAYGLCGMALAMFVYDAEQHLRGVSVEAPADCGVELTPDFFIVSNPNLSAKSVWNSSLKHFQLVAAMAVGNLLARGIGRRKEDIGRELHEALLQSLVEEGSESCGLDSGEVKALCDNSFSYLHRLLWHRAVNDAIGAMARELDSVGSLSHDRIMNFLLPLSRL